MPIQFNGWGPPTYWIIATLAATVLSGKSPRINRLRVWHGACTLIGSVLGRVARLGVLLVLLPVPSHSQERAMMTFNTLMKRTKAQLVKELLDASILGLNIQDPVTKKVLKPLEDYEEWTIDEPIAPKTEKYARFWSVMGDALDATCKHNKYHKPTWVDYGRGNAALLAKVREQAPSMTEAKLRKALFAMVKTGKAFVNKKGQMISKAINDKRPDDMKLTFESQVKVNKGTKSKPRYVVLNHRDEWMKKHQSFAG